MPDYIKMSQEELDSIIAKHEKWLLKEPDGEQARLSGFMFDGLNLCYCNLSNSIINNCYFNRCDITDSCLQGSDLTESVFKFCDLSYSTLSKCSMCGIVAEVSDFNYCNFDADDIFSGVFARCSLISSSFYNNNLSFTKFFECSINHCVFIGSDMSSSKFQWCNIVNISVKNVKNFPYIPMTCPENGSFTAWKRAGGFIVKLQIPEDARRSSATGRKCRCDKAIVVAIDNIDGSPTELKEVTSDYDENFVYRVGETVTEPDFCDNRFYECASGIHFFMTRQEAVEYV